MPETMVARSALDPRGPCRADGDLALLRVGREQQQTVRRDDRDGDEPWHLLDQVPEQPLQIAGLGARADRARSGAPPVPDPPLPGLPVPVPVALICVPPRLSPPCPCLPAVWFFEFRRHVATAFLGALLETAEPAPQRLGGVGAALSLPCLGGPGLDDPGGPLGQPLVRDALLGHLCGLGVRVGVGLRVGLLSGRERPLLGHGGPWLGQAHLERRLVEGDRGSSSAGSAGSRDAVGSGTRRARGTRSTRGARRARSRWVLRPPRSAPCAPAAHWSWPRPARPAG